MSLSRKGSWRVAVTGGASLALALGPGIAANATVNQADRPNHDARIRVCKEVKGHDDGWFGFRIREVSENVVARFDLRDGQCYTVRGLDANTKYRVREEQQNHWTVKRIETRKCYVVRDRAENGSITVEVNRGDRCTITFTNERDRNNH